MHIRAVTRAEGDGNASDCLLPATTQISTSRFKCSWSACYRQPARTRRWRVASYDRVRAEDVLRSAGRPHAARQQVGAVSRPWGWAFQSGGFLGLLRKCSVTRLRRAVLRLNSLFPLRRKILVRNVVRDRHILRRYSALSISGRNSCANAAKVWQETDLFARLPASATLGTHNFSLSGGANQNEQTRNSDRLHR
jgi:hypothetical protein